MTRVALVANHSILIHYDFYVAEVEPLLPVYRVTSYVFVGAPGGASLFSAFCRSSQGCEISLQHPIQGCHSIDRIPQSS